MASSQGYDNQIYINTPTGDFPYHTTDQDPLLMGCGFGSSSSTKLDGVGMAGGGVPDNPMGIDDFDDEFEDMDENQKKERRILEMHR